MLSVSTPFELLRTLGDSLRALAELPTAIEGTLRETNALIADARAELSLLGTQVRRMMDQLDQMAAVTDRLVEGTQAIAAAAQSAQQQMALTTVQLSTTNRTLEQLVRLVEPLDRVTRSLGERFQRLTGRRDAADD
jgi:methyl-accepting chemotaxis protein